MKTSIFNLALASGLCLLALPGFGQVTYETNNPTANPIPLGYVGWNDNTNENLDFLQNNMLRMRMSGVDWPGYNGSRDFDDASRIFFGIDGNEEVPFSMMHLGFNPPLNLQRPWMNVGTTYTAGADMMHVGLLQRPEGATGFFGNLIVDAVVAWGCNENAPVGPDNLRFLFLTPTNLSGSGAAPEGLETVRITPQGNVGIGAEFSNDLQPHRRAVVHQRTDSAQFRIAWDLNSDPVLGTHADFQVSPEGNLHIRPRDENTRRTTALGFLPGEQANPINNATIQTTLDVGGITRIRNLRDTLSNCLVTGFNAPIGSGQDNFLTRLDFLEGEEAGCTVIAKNHGCI